MPKPDKVEYFTTNAPDQPATIPTFETDFFDGTEIRTKANTLIENIQEFSGLTEPEDDGNPLSTKIEYFWARTLGSSNGEPVLGKAGKASGLIKHLTKATFVVQLAAEALTDLDITNGQLEALIYHQLCHLGIDEVELKNEEGTTYKPVIRAHEVEMFTGEYRRYGAWSLNLIVAERTFATQLRLDGMPTGKTGGRGRKRATPAIPATPPETLLTPPPADMEPEEIEAQEAERSLSDEIEHEATGTDPWDAGWRPPTADNVTPIRHLPSA